MTDNTASSTAKMPYSAKNHKMVAHRKGKRVETQLRNNSQNGRPTRTSWRELGTHNYIKILIIGGLFCYLFYNDIERIIQRWLSDPSWSHGFLIPLFSLYFINQHKSKILNLQTNPNYLGLLFMICGIIFYPLNIASPSGYAYLRPIGMIATLGAVILFLGGWRLIKYTWLPVVFLVFAVPLPNRYYVALTMPMRKLAAAVSTAILNMVSGVEATVSGVVIDVIYNGEHIEPLNVAEACSGMRLLMAFLALGVAMAYLHYRPMWQRIVLLVSTIPIAVFCNMIRVTITGFIYIFWDPKYAQDVYHDMLGMAMLPLAFALYGALALFMSSLFIEETEAQSADIVIRRREA